MFWFWFFSVSIIQNPPIKSTPPNIMQSSNTKIRLFIGFKWKTPDPLALELLNHLRELGDIINPPNYKSFYSTRSRRSSISSNNSSNSRRSSSRSPSPSSTSSSSSNSNRSRRRSPSPSRAAMKPADQIMKRILHDVNLKEEEFTVVWEDRFLGLLEQSIPEFLEGNIPRHRIRQFKQNSFIIWDRGKKIDFLTNGIPQNIQRRICLHRVVNSEESETEDESFVASNSSSQPTVPSISIPSVPNSLSSKLPKIKPELMSNNPGLKLNVLRPCHLHFTLIFLGNIDVSHVSTIKTVLETAAKSFSGPFKVPIQSVGAFRNFASPFVLWLGSKTNKPFLPYVEKLKTLLSAYQIPFDDPKRNFVPHMTLTKVKMPKGFQLDSFAKISLNQSPKTPFTALSQILKLYQDCSFGQLETKTLDLFESRDDGYHVIHSFPFN